jgi:hypothetical protein
MIDVVDQVPECAPWMDLLLSNDTVLDMIADMACDPGYAWDYPNSPEATALSVDIMIQAKLEHYSGNWRFAISDGQTL